MDLRLDFGKTHGQVWRWALAWRRELSQEELQQMDLLTALLVNHHTLPNQQDSLCWKGKTVFTAKALQQMMYLEIAVEVQSLVCTVWMNLVPPKVEIFMWLALLGKLNTKEMLCKRGVLQEEQNTCTFCSAHSENLNHILLNCQFSWEVWCSIANDLGQQAVKKPTFQQFYEAWLAVSWKSTKTTQLWVSTVFAMAWKLWMVRNEIIFNQQRLDRVEVCYSIKWVVAMWTKLWKDSLPYTTEEIVKNFTSFPQLLP